MHDSVIPRAREPAAKKQRRELRLSPALWSPLLALGLWQVGVMTGYIEARFFPAPSAIAAKLWQLLGEAQFWRDMGYSLQRVAIGFAMGALPGVLLGLAMGMFKPVRSVFQPLVAGLYPLPKIAILPLIMLVFGLGEMSKYVVVAIGVFFIMVINTMGGVLNIPRIYFDVPANLNAPRWRIYLTVGLPGALPGIFTGFRLATGVSLLLLVSAEFVGAEAGIGYRIWWSWTVFWVENMYAGLAVIALLGYLLSLLVDLLEKIFLPWRRNP